MNSFLSCSSVGAFAGQPTLLKYAVILSFPPPILSNSPYKSTSHVTPSSLSWKVWLKDMRWPSFSVSTRTPSQSNRRAEGRVEEEEDDDAEQLKLRGGTLLTLVVVVVIPNVVVVGLDILRAACVVKYDDDDDGT